jgi:hypothetical protein
MLFKELIELLLGIGAVIILVLLMVSLFGSSYEKLDKGAKGLFNTLEEQIAIANEGGEGEFAIWQEKDEDDKGFFLVYFGGEFRYNTYNKESFISTGGDNTLCVCYWDGEEGTCDYCEELKYPIIFNGEEKLWVIQSGERISIKKGDEQYEVFKT